MAKTDKLIYQEYVMRESGEFHAPYMPEVDFYTFVKNGDIRKIRKLVKEDFADKKGLGKLSKDKLQSLKYHFVITAAMLSRYCIEGGMEHEKAYNMSDMYINEADKCQTLKELSDLHKIMAIDYTSRMKYINNANVLSRPVSDCIEYIYLHLHEKISLDDLADMVNLSPSYLSRLFKSETGITVSNYIQNKKIETAANMLKFSEYTPGEISTLLAFPSQSYFTEKFKKHMGVPPLKYKKQSHNKL
jgi:AraC-like DNA-binding protein